MLKLAGHDRINLLCYKNNKDNIINFNDNNFATA